MAPFDMMGEMRGMNLMLRNEFESLTQFSGLHNDIYNDNNNQYKATP